MILSMILRQRKGRYDPKNLEGVLPVLDSRLYDGGNGGVVLCAGFRAEASADLELGLGGAQGLLAVVVRRRNSGVRQEGEYVVPVLGDALPEFVQFGVGTVSLGVDRRSCKKFVKPLFHLRPHFRPDVRPMVRGKARAKVEFGSKIGAAVVDGFTFIDHFSWDAYNESEDLMPHLRAYRKRFGHLPALVEADKIYLNRRNRRILKLLHIKVGGKPLGHPAKADADKEEYEALMARYSGERNEVEGTFGPGKRVYRANNIRAKLSDTGESWCSACYFAKNAMKFLKGLLHALFELVCRCWNLFIETGKSVALADCQMLCVNVANT